MKKLSLSLEKFKIFSAFDLKLIACVFMVIDHIGAQFFPDIEILRILGRITFPIFAFLIAEGSLYTRNKLKRFLMIFFFGVLCETAYIIYSGKLYGNVLLTFSASVVLIHILQKLKNEIFLKKAKGIVLFSLLFVMSIVTAFFLSQYLGLDYGFFGIMLPVAVSFFHYKEGEYNKVFSSLDKMWIKLIALCLCLFFIALRPNALSCQMWGFLGVIFLMLYNGKVGRFKLKYGFYIFYPAHLLIIALISVLINTL